MEKVLLKDIVIPKGTVFSEAPKEINHYGNDHFEAIIGLSKNTTGSFIYCIYEDYIEELTEYFTNLKK